MKEKPPSCANGQLTSLRFQPSKGMLPHLLPKVGAFTQVRYFVFIFAISHNSSAEFEIGLELDSAEVRGILLYNNEEWGR